ncbi:hypothetical protein [uncultured Phenylobacterium sp.]|uniref:hypothetical protein n=1 Tax=uncultured Phenylobacterium sp. TaxID=349273 RepID=UPI0025DA325E|nr:hypothetical protein [uncultured Phenylobacterium sp.]
MSADEDRLSCPSAQPDMQDARIFGVIAGTPDEPRVAYLKKKAQVTPEMLEQLDGLDPTRVFRYAARCENGRCAQYEGGRCSLAQRIVTQLSPVVSDLPSCQIRDTCRWFVEEAGAACLRCPQVVTRVPSDQNALRAAAFKEDA